MADIYYDVEVTVRCGGRVVDIHSIEDEDYGLAMAQLAQWAVLSYGEKDL